MKLTKQEITKDLFADKRLQPINQTNSKLVLQLFIGKITYNGKTTYELLYGWCLITSRPESSNQVSISTFEKVFSSATTSVLLARLSVYQDSEIILRLVNGLLNGLSFKDVATTLSLDTSKIKFDFVYGAAKEGNVRIRPIIFNETAPNVSRNMFEKYMLHSPFGTSPAFTLPVVNLDKLSSFRFENALLPDYKDILIAVLDNLTTETNLPFSTTGAARFGNIEFISGPCTNIFERAQVFFENISEEILVDGIKEKTSRKVQVTVLSNEVTLGQSLLVNCFSTNGGQIILDEVREVIHKDNAPIIIDFETQEPLSNLVVSIWVKDNEKWQIWFKDSAVLLRHISLRMGAVGTTGKVSSPFLDRVRSAGSHMESAVSEAMEINKTSYMTSTIGGKGLDPWVDVDYNFSKLVASLTPQKSDAVFFPKGWSVDSEEHGALAFLQWFTSLCDNATNVIIQDPYFDTVGLEFIARTSNSATSFDIITCTQIPSDDDSPAVPGEKPATPDRATRLVNMLTGLPELFAGSNITINDYRNKSGNSKALLHDRYIIVYLPDQEPKGYHLSNSIQNATQNYPLLITPIPIDVLRQVEKYSAELIEQGDKAGTFEVIKISDSKANSKKVDNAATVTVDIDKKLFSELKCLVQEQGQTDYDAIKRIFKSYVSGDELRFAKFWNTFGYFLANIPLAEDLLSKVKDWFPAEHSGLLYNYLFNLADNKSKGKFPTTRGLDRSGYHVLFLEDFKEALRASFQAEHGFFENFGFGNYQAGYASWLLLKIDPVIYERLIKSIITEISQRRQNENLNSKPILRVAALLFSELAKELFWHGDEAILKVCLQSEVMPLRTLAIAAIGTDAVAQKERMNFENVQVFFGVLSPEEEASAFVSLLHQTRFERGLPQEQLQKDCFTILLKIAKGLNRDLVFNLVDEILEDHYFKQIEAHVTNSLLIPLVDSEICTIQEVLKYWKLKFESQLEDFEDAYNVGGIIDIAGWSICAENGEEALKFVTLLQNVAKRCFNTIRKPFMSGTKNWEGDYSRLLMIQSAAIIALNYMQTCEGVPPGLNDKLVTLVKDIAELKQNYPHYRDVYRIHTHNKQLTEEHVN